MDLDFGQAITRVLGKYANFNGRAARSEFWWWAVFTFIVMTIASTLDSVLGAMAQSSQIGVLTTIVWLGLLVPSLAVGARRLHDCNRPGWWLLLLLIPMIGFFALVFWFVQPGTRGDNLYGADPLTRMPGTVPDTAGPRWGSESSQSERREHNASEAISTPAPTAPARATRHDHERSTWSVADTAPRNNEHDHTRASGAEADAATRNAARDATRDAARKAEDSRSAKSALSNEGPVTYRVPRKKSSWRTPRE